MSYVAISDKFRSDVRSQLRRMRNNEVNQIAEIDYKLSSARSDLIAWAWGEHLHLKDVIPAKWCKQISNVAIRVETMYRGSIRINADLTTPLPVPPTGAPQTVYSIPLNDPEVKPYVEREGQLYDIAERWDKVDKQIMEFLGKCKSVNEALKLWPQVEMYIPSEFIARVNEKKDRVKGGPSEAAEALKNLDTDHLTTAAVISRMSR